MAFDLAKNIIDKDLEKDGVWMEYDEDTRFLVARKTNPRYKAFISKKYRENERLINSTSKNESVLQKAEEVASEFLLEGLAKYILVGWEGVLSDGKPLEYSFENSKLLLSTHDDLRDMIEEFADSRDNYIAEKDKKDAENLGK